MCCCSHSTRSQVLSADEHCQLQQLSELSCDSDTTCLLQAQLQAELAPYGIDTQVVDRYIVSSKQSCPWLGLQGQQQHACAVKPCSAVVVHNGCDSLHSHAAVSCLPMCGSQVTQSRQAVDVGDPVGLVKQLEALTGAVDYEAAIQQHSALLEQLAAGMEDTKAQMGRWV